MADDELNPVVGIDLDLDVVHFRENRDGGGGCMNTTGGFRDWDSLNAMHAALILEP